MHHEGKHRKQHLSKNAADVELDSIIQFAELQVELDDEEAAAEGEKDDVRTKAKTFIKKPNEVKDSKLGALISRDRPGMGPKWRNSMVCIHEEANKSSKSLKQGDALLSKELVSKRMALQLGTPKHTSESNPLITPQRPTEAEVESQRRDLPSFQGDDTIQTIPEMMEKTGDETSQNITTSQDIRSTLDLKHDLAAAQINTSRFDMADNRDGTARFNGQTPTSVLS